MISIKAEKRNTTGSYFAKEDRKKGKIPANFYGKNIDNMNLLVDPQEVKKLKSKRNCCVMSLQIDDKKEDILIQDIQYHPVTMEPLHVDFLSVNSKEEVKVQVPIRYLNTDKCVGIKQGGHLNKIYRRISLMCLPENIPEFIEIDTTAFHIGKVIKIADIDLPDNVKYLKSEKTVICNIIGRASKQSSSEEGAVESESQDG